MVWVVEQLSSSSRPCPAPQRFIYPPYTPQVVFNVIVVGSVPVSWPMPVYVGLVSCFLVVSLPAAFLLSLYLCRNVVCPSVGTSHGLSTTLSLFLPVTATSEYFPLQLSILGVSLLKCSF